MSQLVILRVAMSLEETQEQTHFHEVSYLLAKKELARLLEHEPLNSSKKKCTQRIIDQIEQLKKSDKLLSAEATSLLDDTVALLNNSMTPEAYQEIARTVQGRSSLAMQILGGLMITLGALVSAAFVAVAAVVGFKPSADGIAAATVLVAGIGLFSGGVRSGLSKSMNELADEVRLTHCKA
jgi:hypothetical protein